MNGYAQLEGHIVAAQVALADRDAVIVVQTQQMESTIVAAQVALADRDAVIAAQSQQISMLSQQMAALNLRAHRAEAAAAGPARSAALRGAAAMASPSAGGASSTPSVAMAAAVASSARRAAAAASNAALLAGTASAAAAEGIGLVPLPLNVERCRLPGCGDQPALATAFMTRAGKKWHTTRLCTAVRGREIVECSVPF